jgi:hypothetical protein
MIVIAEKYGGLGNGLWVFAHFIGWGIEYGVAIANPAFDGYAAYFEGTADDPWCRYPSRPNVCRNVARSRRANYRLVKLVSQIGTRLKIRTPWTELIDIGWTELYELGREEHIRTLRSRKLILVKGWEYRDEARILKHVQAIRIYFTPRQPHMQRIDELEARVRATCDVVVGVHIRRGDYLNFMGGQFYYEPDVYLGMMSKVSKLLGDREVSFLICSDEPVAPVISSNFNSHLGTNHLIEDMYSLARCDYLIGPPSTYSMWASYYGGVPLLQIMDPGMEPTLADFVALADRA